MMRETRSARSGRRTSYGFCEGTHGQEPGRCYDARERCKGTRYRAVPALTWS
jgi:hypothetical protein